MEKGKIIKFPGMATETKKQEKTLDQTENRIFSGYSKTGKPVSIVLDNNHLYVVYTDTGRKRKYNDEYYFPDSDFYPVEMALLNDGFRYLHNHAEWD